MSRLATYIILVLSLISLLIILIYPNQFQKFNSIRAANDYKSFSTSDQSASFDVSNFIKNIPYGNSPDYVFSVEPAKKYENTILKGNGDCSTMSFGAAYYFINHDIDFELIHFLPEKTLFLGGGHVAMRMPFNYESELSVGIVDIAGGGIVTDGSSVFDAKRLKRNSSHFRFIKLNDLAPKYYENYYTGKYLADVYFGYTPKDDIKRYFQFIDKYYIRLHNDKLEKYIFDGLALISNNYYNIYVDTQFLAIFKHQILFFSLVLFLVRILIFLTPVVVIAEVYRRNKHVRHARIEHSTGPI